jgi:hypothetical protein
MGSLKVRSQAFVYNILSLIAEDDWPDLTQPRVPGEDSLLLVGGPGGGAPTSGGWLGVKSTRKFFGTKNYLQKCHITVFSHNRIYPNIFVSGDICIGEAEDMYQNS